MQRYCRLFNINEEEKDVRNDLEGQRMRVYFDLLSDRFVCHQIRRVNRGDYPKKIINILYNEAKREYDNVNRKVVFKKSEREVRLDGIREILTRKVEDRRSFFRELEDLDVDAYMSTKDYDEWHQWIARKKRFFRKCGLNRSRLNWWFTVTWDPEKFLTEEEWLKTLVRWISNNAFRYGLKVLGGFEYGDENGRLHFHGIAYVPDDFFVAGDLYKVNRFSDKDKRWKTSFEYGELREKFGINEWESLKGMDNKEFMATLHYVADYATKQNGKMYYSRGLKDCGEQYVDPEELLMLFDDGATKYYLKNGFEFGKDSLDVMLRNGHLVRMGVTEVPEDEFSDPFRDDG